MKLNSSSLVCRCIGAAIECGASKCSTTAKPPPQSFESIRKRSRQPSIDPNASLSPALMIRWLMSALSAAPHLGAIAREGRPDHAAFTIAVTPSAISWTAIADSSSPAMRVTRMTPLSLMTRMMTTE